MVKKICVAITLVTFLLTLAVLSQEKPKAGKPDKSPMVKEKSMAKGTMAKGDAMAGKQVYMDKCSRCHGDAGKGDGKEARLPAIKRAMHDWTQPGFLVKWTDEDLFKLVSEGAKPPKQKSDKMPAYGMGKAKEKKDELTDDQIHNVVAYIKTTFAK